MRKAPWAIGLTTLLTFGCGSQALGSGKNTGPGSVMTLASADGTSGSHVLLLPVDKRPKAPGFDGTTAWLNVDRPLTLDALKHLEAAFAKDPVVVIGVHSPKFDAEQEAKRLQSVVRSYDIRHPIAVDGNMNVWRNWGVEAWPSVIVLDAEGRLV